MSVTNPIPDFPWWSHSTINGGWRDSNKRKEPVMSKKEKVIQLGETLKRIDLDFLEASSDIIKDRGYGVLDPKSLPIDQLAYVNYASKGQHELLRRVLFNFPCQTEGRPLYSYRKFKKPLAPHLCDWRLNYLYERRTLEELFKQVGVLGDNKKGLGKYLITPQWYISGEENIIVNRDAPYHPDLNLLQLTPEALERIKAAYGITYTVEDGYRTVKAHNTRVNREVEGEEEVEGTGGSINDFNAKLDRARSIFGINREQTSFFPRM